MSQRPIGPRRLRTRLESRKGRPQSSAHDGEAVARMIQRVSAVLGRTSVPKCNRIFVTPDCAAASVSLRLATRSTFLELPQSSSTTAPSAPQDNPCKAARKPPSASGARMTRMRSGGRPRSNSPATESSPIFAATESWRIQRTGRRPETRIVKPAAKPMADTPCRSSDANTSCRAPVFSPPRKAASAPACPSTAAASARTRGWVSKRAIAPRNAVSV